MKPEVILLDDQHRPWIQKLVGDALDVLKQLAKEGVNMVVVTHEMGFTRDAGQSCYFMVGGRIVRR